MKQTLPSLAKILTFLLICVIPIVGVYLLGTAARQSQATPTGSLTVEEVNIPVSKTQMTTEGQPLKSNQLIQLSVYVPKDDDKGLTAKVITYAKFVNQNENFVILSVPKDQAASLEEALLTENAKLIYHEIAQAPEPPAASSTPATTPIPKPSLNTVQLKIAVKEVQGGVASLTLNMMVKIIVVEQLAVYHVDREPIATYEPKAPVDACAVVKGFMVEDLDGLINKEATPPTYILLEISETSAPKIVRALTNVASAYLLPLRSCNLKS